MMTRAEYEKLVLPEGERVELIEGEIVALGPIDPEHAAGVDSASMTLALTFGTSHIVRVQNPILALEHSEPQPDVVLVSRSSYSKWQHPSLADLVIEVSNTSLAYDRREKASLYAAAGQPLYWIVNLIHDQLEVYTNPVPDPDAPFRWSYGSFQSLGPDQTVTLLGQTLSVRDFLP